MHYSLFVKFNLSLTRFKYLERLGKFHVLSELLSPPPSTFPDEEAKEELLLLLLLLSPIFPFNNCALSSLLSSISPSSSVRRPLLSRKFNRSLRVAPARSCVLYVSPTPRPLERY